MKTKTVRNTAIMKLFIGFSLASIMQSCIHKEDMDFNMLADNQWNPNFSVPLIHSQLNMTNILHLNDTVTPYLDTLNFVTLVYKGDMYSIYGYQFLPLMDQATNMAVNLSPAEITTLSTVDSVTLNRNTLHPFGVSNGERIDSMTLGHGMLNINISSTVQHSGVLTVTLPSARQNGIAFTKQIPFSYNNQVPVVAIGNFDLEGYNIDMTSTGSFNVLPVNYSVKFYDSANPTLTSETFSVAASFQNMIIKKVYGSFGLRTMTVYDDSTRIAIFNHMFSGNLSFDNPHVQFLISNSFGIDLDAHFTSLFTQSTLNGSTTITGFPDPIPVNMPAAAGETGYSNFILDKTNSNFRVAINTNPQYLGYRATVACNPHTSLINFIEDSSKFKVDVRVELPLNGVAQGLVIEDTVNFHLNDIKEVEWAKFRINTSNGFPLDANTQLYFVDSSYTVLDSLISPSEEIIRAAITDPITGMVSHPTTKITDEYFSKARMSNIYNAQKIIVRGVMNSPGSSNAAVQFYPDYILDVRLAVQVQLKINIQ